MATKLATKRVVRRKRKRNPDEARTSIYDFTMVEDPNLTAGRKVRLCGRGTTLIYDYPALTADNTTTYLLIHGWTVNSALNFHRVIAELNKRTGARVIAMDQRGHGQGIRPLIQFRLTDCADDISALIDTLELKNVTVIGYSMGGAIAQLVALRSPDKIDAAVFCATTCYFAFDTPSVKRDVIVRSITTGLTILPPAGRKAMLERTLRKFARPDFPAWVRSEVRQGDIAMVAQAGLELGRFDSRPWLPTLTVPTAVVKTTLDQTVPVSRQDLMINCLPDTSVHECVAKHEAAVTDSELFLDALLKALNSVSLRIPRSAATAEALTSVGASV